MLFNSLEFLIFLPLVLLAYSVLKSYRTTLLLVASYFFYGSWNWSYLVLIIFSTMVDYACAIRMELEVNKSRRKLYLLISIITNLSLLGYFKYFNFFTSQFNELLTAVGSTYLIPYSGFLLPMGISFYTFQTMAYSVDVYHRRCIPEKDFSNFALYVSFFPQLVAGPIERPGNLIGQLKSLKDLNQSNLKEGFYRIIFGFFKKLVVADRLALFVNQVYASPENYDGFILLIATVFFAFQIYCDFSGYSDIAIGVAKIFGVNLMENFKMPYLSQSIREFWSRWHISLSTWFRDYLYIPLGGNQRSFLRNVFIVFIVSGLWHGANWTFLIWGFLHGLYFLIERNIQIRTSSRFGKVVKTTLTFLAVCLAWVFFRANSVHEAFFIVKTFGQINTTFVFDIMYQLNHMLLEPSTLVSPLNLNYGQFYFQMTIGDLFLSFLLIPILMIIEFAKYHSNFNFSEGTQASLYFLLAATTLLLGVFSENQFIYFQF